MLCNVEGNTMNKQIADMIINKVTLERLRPEELLELHEADDITQTVFSAVQSEVLRRIT
jgi:hypothetical protein